MIRLLLSCLALATALAPVTAQAPDRAALVATLLATADAHAADPSPAGRKALATNLATLERLGVRPLLEEADDALGDWRRIAGRSQTPPNRGRILGPAYRRGWIDAGQQLRVEQLFLSGQTATVSLAATPEQLMAMAISAPGAADVCVGGRNCKWLPLFTQRYVITIQNLGTQRARFYLVVD